MGHAVFGSHCIFDGTLDAPLSDSFGAKGRKKAKNSFGLPTLKDRGSHAHTHSFCV